MMNNNKILTVSYGTFSCTLEGFEDSFGTMKAIAEYFRDLTADDRYFGAEPPQPDAEMLARIAEKEVARKVQAREHDGKIVLSAYHDDSPSEMERPALESDASRTPAAVQQEDMDVATPDAGVDLSVPETLAEDPQTAEAAVTEEPADVDLDDLAAAAPIEIETAQDATTVQTQSTFEEDENDIVPGQPDAEVEAFFAEAQLKTSEKIDFEDVEDPAPAAPKRDTAPKGESIAEKLQRIRAVVAQTKPAEETDDFLEDEHAGAQAQSAAVLETAVEDIQDALEADDETEAAAQIAKSPVAREGDDVDDILARLQEYGDEREPEADSLLSEAADDVETETDVSDRLKNLFGDEDDAPEAPVSKKNITTTPDLTTEVEPLDVAQEPEPGTPRARVIKVKRADLDAAIERGDLEEFSIEDDAETEQTISELDRLAPSKTAQTSLSPDQEDELARELAALEADIDSGADRAKPAPEARKPRRDAAASALPSLDERSDADMNRLLAEADHKMDEPESATRRDAFSHLRAAVAAKKADVAMGGSVDEEKRDDAYRSDLAQVVRPRRPEGNTSRTPRPSDKRPAPLKLVAEQRIDAGRPHTEGPVRPRRVSAVKEPVQTNDASGSFADYAQEVGAHTLPQLLEAAAAYMSFVEGCEQFSRPQLMTKVRQAGAEDDFSREDGLRSFGQLLRSGKIEKIKGGRFTVSDDIGFRPDQRAAG